MYRLIKISLAVVAIALLVGIAASAPMSEITGKLEAVYADKIVLADSQGKDTTFQLNSDARVLINGQESKIEELLAGESVTVTFEMSGDRPMASEVRCKRD